MKKTVIALAGVFILAATGPADAHHSGTMYDREKDVVMEGVVKEWQWTNPHTYLQVMVTDATGKAVEWSIEGGALVLMKRAGWEKTSLNPGDKVSILFHPLKSGAPGGTVIEVTNKSKGGVFKYHG